MASLTRRLLLRGGLAALVIGLKAPLPAFAAELTYSDIYSDVY